MKNSVPSLSWRLVSRVVLASFVAVLVALAWLYWKNYSVQGLGCFETVRWSRRRKILGSVSLYVPTAACG